MKIAVVFDWPVPGLEHADFKKQVEARVPEAEYEVAEALMHNGHEVFLIGFHDNLRRLLDRLKSFEPDLVFNATESFMGKARYDYGITALLEMKGYRYTGSPPEAQLLARDKAASKKILTYHSVRVPGFRVYELGEEVEPPEEIGFPLIVKPTHEDASVGISQSSVVKDAESLRDRAFFIHRKLKQPAIAEEFVDGRELYVGIIGNHRLQVLPIVEIAFDKMPSPEMKIATYSAKWDLEYRQRWGIRNIFARRIGERALKEIHRVAQVAYSALGLRDYGRIDIRLTREQEVYLLEANPNPYIAFGEDMANAAERAGLDYYAFIEHIVEEAVTRYETAQAQA
jgi:D-alanine-D-alanine ligase